MTDLLLGFRDDEEMTEEEQAKMLYMRTLEDEKREATELAQESSANFKDPDYVSKSALRLFKTKVKISEEQFELIMSLCRVRFLLMVFLIY